MIGIRLFRRAFVLLLCAVFALLGGCASVALPPPLSRAEAQRLRELPLPLSVGVARHGIPIYSDGLAETLEAARVFARVAPLESYSQPPDLVATIEREVYGTAVIPAGTLLSAGVLPSMVDEAHGYVFALAPAAHRNRKTVVDASYRGTTTLGLLGLLVSATPGYTSSNPERTKRYLEMLAFRTLDRIKTPSVRLRPWR